MRQIIVLIFLTANLQFAFAQNLTKEQQQIVSNFINCIKNHEKEKVSDMISYPFRREYPIPTIKSKEEFVKRYNEVFDDKLTKLIAGTDAAKDWNEAGWRGISFRSGEVWIDYNGRLMTVNYQSEIETRMRDSLIKAERNQLHESIRNYVKPIHILETSKYRIRIDDMGNWNYRYCSWKIESKMSDKPDLVILKGEFVAKGSGGNHSFVFTNGEYKYECDIIVLGEEDSPPAILTIYKGEKAIISENANIILK